MEPLKAVGWSGEKINKIDEECGKIIQKHKTASGFKSAVDSTLALALFKSSWEPVTSMDIFKELCGGFATVTMTTAVVESNFSLLGMIKCDYRTSLSALSLEVCLHAM